MENEFFSLTIDRKTGIIKRIRDKTRNQEVVKSGANILELYEDRPVSFSAWDIDFYHQKKLLQRGIKVHTMRFFKGRHYTRCVIFGTLLQSKIIQEIYLFNHYPFIYIDSKVDWQERSVVLKTAQEVDVLANTATYGIQGAAICRPTHRNTLYDQARFEVPAQCWMDMSESGFGVALLSDSKYGFSALGSFMRMTALRSPSAPDPEADRGTHHFSYCLYPHPGTWQEADVPTVADNFARGPIVLENRAGDLESRISVKEGLPGQQNNFVIETVKHAERGRAIILRGHETKGSRGKAIVKVGFYKMRKAFICNLLEEEKQALKIKNKNNLEINYRPYEIITIKLIR